MNHSRRTALKREPRPYRLRIVQKRIRGIVRRALDRDRDVRGRYGTKTKRIPSLECLDGELRIRRAQSHRVPIPDGQSHSVSIDLVFVDGNTVADEFTLS